MKGLYGRRNHSGLTLVPKLTLGHINLTSYSRMRVDLAAQVITTYNILGSYCTKSLQVLSKTVADALEYCSDTDTFETERFIRTFDKFFDIMNTRCLEEGIQKLKPNLKAFETPDDPRLDVRQLITRPAKIGQKIWVLLFKAFMIHNFVIICFASHE